MTENVKIDPKYPYEMNDEDIKKVIEGYIKIIVMGSNGVSH